MRVVCKWVVFTDENGYNRCGWVTTIDAVNGVILMDHKVYRGVTKWAVTHTASYNK